MQCFQEALDLALRLHHGQTWPGSRIPCAAHALEVACRVAALGGEEETILAALLHEARRDRMPGAMLTEIRTGFGDRVAELLEACWTHHHLPHAGWEGWLEEAAGVDDTELRLLIACDTLACFRNLLLDWQVLARLWDEEPTGDPADRAWLLAKAGLPDPGQLVRKPWVPPELDHPSPQANRAELVAAYRSWLTLPLGRPEAIAAYPALALAYQGDAWARWVERQELLPLLRGWGFQGLARELHALLGSLHGLPGQAQAGLLRQGARGVEFMTPAVAAACLERLTLMELRIVLRNGRSELVRAFARHVPPELVAFCAAGPDPSDPGSLSVPLLLHWLGEVARDGRLLTLRAMDAPEPEPAPTPCFPGAERYGRALALLLTQLAEEPWPGTTIPYAFHPLEVSSLVLTAGWDEETAILALLHDLPRCEATLATVAEALGADLAAALRSFWTLEGPVHRVPGTCPTYQPPASFPPAVQAVGLMDALSLLRFVAEDCGALAPERSLRRDPSREELTRRFTFFRGLLHGKPLGLIADTVLIGSRFGPSLLAWRKALPAFRSAEPSLTAQPAGVSEELRILFTRLVLPLPEVNGLLDLLGSLSPDEVLHLVHEVGPGQMVTALMDEGWATVWLSVRPKLGRTFADLLASEFLAQLPGPKATRAAQTALLSVAARMQRDRMRGTML